MQDQFQDCEPSPLPRRPEVDEAIKNELRKRVFTPQRWLPIKEDVGTCWQELGLKLQIPYGELRNIGEDYTYAKDRGFAVLQSWWNRNGRDATVGCLLDAFENIGQKRIADALVDLELQETYKDQTETSRKLQEECNRLKFEIRDCKNVREHLRSKIQIYEKDRECLKSEIQDYKEDGASLRSEIQIYKDLISTLRDELSRTPSPMEPQST